MNRDALALFIIVLMMSLPVVSAAEVTTDDYDPSDVGSAITVNVKAYEPTILTSNLIEDNDVPIYVYLSGVSVGSLIGSEYNVEPIYGGIEIDQVKMKALNIETTDALVGEPKYFKPNKFTDNSLGYLMLTMKQIEKEAEVPEEVNLSFTAEIWFKEAERLYSLSKTALVLPVDTEEAVWTESLNQFGAQYSFFGGRGLIRVYDVTGSQVGLTVYSNKDLYWPIIAAPRELTTITLKEGETSEYIDLGLTDQQALIDPTFRVTVSDIRDPAAERATVQVEVGGGVSQVTVTEGSSLYPGSSWTVKSISTGRARDGSEEYTLKIKDKKGNTETIETTYGSGFSEEEQAIFDQEFYDYSKRSTYPNQLYYTSETKTIEKVAMSDLQSVFDAYSLDVDVSELEGDDTKTNSVRISSELSLQEVLVQMLPSGYFYYVADVGEETIGIKRFEGQDPCDSATILEDSDITVAYLDDNRYDNTERLNMLCTAIYQFEEITQSYDDEEYPLTGESVVDMAYDYIAKSYETIQTIGSLEDDEVLGAREGQMVALQKLVDRGSSLSTADPFSEQLLRLQNALYGDITYGTESISDNGQFVYVKLIDVRETDASSMSNADISMNGITDTFYYGDVVVDDKTDNGGEYHWEVYEIQDESVKMKKIYDKVDNVRYTKTSYETLGLGDKETVDQESLQVKDIETKKEVHLTVTPGSGGTLKSTTNFSIHIPIEGRAFDLNPDKIDERIEKAKKAQKTLGEITAKLESLIKYWTYVCLAVFAAVTLKSSFGSTDGAARHDAIYGVDDEGGWAKFCDKNSGYGEAYNTYDTCMLENAGAIQEDIDKAQSAKDWVEEQGGDFSGESWYDGLVDEYGGKDNLNNCKELVGDSTAFYSDDGLNDLAYQYKLEEIDAYSASGVDGNTATADSNEVLQEHVKAQGSACQASLNGVEKGDYSSIYGSAEGDELQDLKEGVAKGIFQSDLNKQEISKTTGEVNDYAKTKDFDALTNDYFELEIVGNIFKGNSATTGKVYLESGPVDVKRLTYNDYQTALEEQNKTLAADAEADETSSDGKKCSVAKTDADGCSANQVKGNLLKTELAKFDSVNGKFRQSGGHEITADSGAKWYTHESTGELYLGLEAYSSNQIREDYAEGAKLELYSSGKEEGLPYAVPYKDGNYIKITSYTEANEIKVLELWNVGPDGHLDTNDDVLMAHESALYYNTASPSYEALVNHANTYVQKTLYAGQKIEIDTHTFTVSEGKSKAVLDSAVSSCFDVMDPNDCKLMFNSCDPIMCPPSRFTLGGRWQVDNVVESGLIGSVVLGMGNGDAVPVCLTGVRASLVYWNSMLDGYVECLESAKYEGTSVGICDKIRNVYVCELIVREVAAMMNGHEGGLLDFLANRVYSGYEGGGGEYFNFKENMQEMENAVSYFTTEYATTAFSAFRGRSLEEVGGKICQQALYAKTPWFSDMMNQLTTPEDPNQFYASMTVKPYAPSQGIESYSTYYHIYAGNNANINQIVYSVYLRNSLSGETYYVTESCGGASATLALTEMTDVNLDCPATEGFDELCVRINGETNCGFGSVSTSFSTEYLKDAITYDEALREIDTEEECYPSVSTASPTVSSFAGTDSLILPYTYGALSTGIQRVCSLPNPGTGQGNTADWTKVGTCGEDTEGRDLGYCWINTDELNIRDAQKSGNVTEYFKAIGANLTDGLSEADLWNTEDSQENLVKYVGDLSKAEKEKKYCSTAVQHMELFRDLGLRTLSYEYAAAAQFQLGLLQYSLAGNQDILQSCGIKGRTQIDYIAYVDGETIGSRDEIGVDQGEGTFQVDLANVMDNEEVTWESSKGSKGDCESSTIYENTVVCELDLDVDSESYEEKITITVSRGGDATFEQTFTFTAGTEEEEDDSAASFAAQCTECGWLNTYCSEDACHGNGDACYWTDEGVFNDCFACSEVKDMVEADGGDEDEDGWCAALSTDKDRCEENDCYDTFLDSGSCYWDDDANEGKQCKYSGGERTSSDGLNMAEVALEQYDEWKSGNVDECDDGMDDFLKAYYEAGDCDDSAGLVLECTGGNDEVTHWSAAFVSYVAKEAGINFPSSCSHNQYFEDARESPTKYDCAAYSMDEIAQLDEGDVLCYCEGRTCSYDDIVYDPARATGLTHCDVVVDIDSRSIDVIGGNIGDSVSKSTWAQSDVEKGSDSDGRNFAGFISCYDSEVTVSGYSGELLGDFGTYELGGANKEYIVADVDLSGSNEISCVQSVDDPYIASMLDMIAWCEGTDSSARKENYAAGYGVVYGGNHVEEDGFFAGDHPYDDYKSYFASGSPAAGRYQFLTNTYEELQRGDYGDAPTDFSPDEQDVGGVNLLTGKRGVTSADIQEAYQNKEWDALLDDVAPEWACFPYTLSEWDSGGYYDGQGGVSSDDLVTVFEACYDFHTGDYDVDTSGGTSVLAIGTSTTAADQNYADYLADTLPGYSFDSRGYSGCSTAKVSDYLESGDAVEDCNGDETVASFDIDAYDTLIVLSGLNDGLCSGSSDTTGDYLEDIYSYAARKDMQVIAVTMTPAKEWFDDLEASSTSCSVGGADNSVEYTAQVNAWILDQPANVDYVVDAYSVLEGEDGYLDSAYDSGDGLHPNSRGQSAIADAICEAVWPSECS